MLHLNGGDTKIHFVGCFNDNGLSKHRIAENVLISGLGRPLSELHKIY